MTQFPHDKFAKDYIPELLQDYGEVIPSVKVAPEVKEVDVFFVPKQPVPTITETLGLLGKLAQTSCLLEVYRNPVNGSEIQSCLIKLFEIRNKLGKQLPAEDNLPVLWILTPTLSDKILEQCGTTEQVEQWSQGIYMAPTIYCFGIVVIHQLRSTPETLWLRLLGKGKVQERAISELNDLPANHPKKNSILELVYGLLAVLEINKKQGQSLDTEDEKLIMKISTLYLEKLQEAKNEGRLEGEVNLTIRQLKRLFGSLPIEIETLITSLPITTLEALAEALLDFHKIEDLTDWLANHQ